MAFPITYSEVKEMVWGAVGQTKNARSIIRKSGFRGSSASASAPERPVPEVVLQLWLWNEIDTGDGPVNSQYSRVLERRFSIVTLAGQTNTLGPWALNAPPILFWLGGSPGFTQVRVCAQVGSSDEDFSLIPGFAIPGVARIDPLFPDFPDTDYFGRARFADTNEYLTTGFGSNTSDGDGYAAPLTAPYTVGAWADIHESFLAAGEVEMALHLRNAESGMASDSPVLGICEIQLR